MFLYSLLIKEDKIVPIRGDRILVKIEEITRTIPGEGETTTEVPIIVKMKRGIATYLNLEEIPLDDPLFLGTFASGVNEGKKFIKRIGGFRFASYTFIAKSKFSITEQYFDDSNEFVEENNDFKSFSIGFPKGHTVNEMFDWIKTWSNINQVRRIRTPSGISYPVNFGNGGAGGGE